MPNRVIIVNKLANKLSFFDCKTREKLGEILTTPRPHEILLAPNKQTAYVSIFGDGIYNNNPHPGKSLIQIDVNSMKLVNEIELAGCQSPHGLMMDPKTGLLWVTGEATGNLVIVDPQAKKVIQSIPLETHGNHWLQMLPDGSKIYVPDRGQAQVHVVDVASRKKISVIALPHPITGIACSGDNRWIYVADRDEPVIHVIDTAQDRVVQKILLNGFPRINKVVENQIRIAVSPDNKYIVVTYYSSGVIAIIDANDHKKQKLTAVAKGPMGMAFSPEHPEQVWVAEHDAGTVRAIDMTSGLELFDFDAGGKGPETLAFY